MVAVMCAAEATPHPLPQHFGRVVVVGGGCYGSYYVRQLLRAAQAGAVQWERLLVIDHDPDCRVARERSADPAQGAAGGALEIVVAEWGEFFAGYLGGASEGSIDARTDAIVPSPLMPHLMYDWVAGRAREHWPGRDIRQLPLERPPMIPWERANPDGTHVVSFAEWMCPINCVEPATCPAIRGPRTWAMPRATHAYAEAARARGGAMDALVFHCRHRAYGVGMFDTSEVLAADAHVRRLGSGAADILIGTVSNCHGIWNRLHIGAAVADAVPTAPVPRQITG